MRGRVNGGPRPPCRVITYDEDFWVKGERLWMDVWYLPEVPRLIISWMLCSGFLPLLWGWGVYGWKGS